MPKRMWLPGSPTTSAPGSRVTGAPSCSAGRADSCCRRAATSPPSSTRPTTPRRATRWATGRARTPRPGREIPNARAARGGRTIPPGSPHDPARANAPRGPRAAAGSRPGSRLRAPMSSIGEIRSVTGEGGALRVHIRRAVHGSGVPLVVANGIGASIELLQPFVDALPADIEVVRFDVPGAGGSPRRSWPYRLPGLARLLRRALDDLGYDRVDMLGVSWGGGLAQQFAVTRGGRCRRLILVSTGTGALMLPGSPRVLRLMTTPRRYRDPKYAQRIAGTIYGGGMC